MHVGVELDPKEFSKLHNLLCSIGNVNNEASELVDKIRATVLKPAYDADHKVFEQRNLHYRLMGKAINAQTYWSMYEIEHLGNEHPFEGAKQVLHGSHWGEGAQLVDIEGSGTYLDLFKAADKAIVDSGDMHHCYIEGFRPHPTDEGVLILSTGS